MGLVTNRERGRRSVGYAVHISKIRYRYCHFPPAIAQHAIWLHCRFTLSFQDVEGLLAERGIEVSYETMRGWVARFGNSASRLGIIERSGRTIGLKVTTFRSDDENEIRSDSPVARRSMGCCTGCDRAAP